ncbi:MAG: biotin/lipoyl-binding protein, partial [Acidimicrobiales bacterium]
MSDVEPLGTVSPAATMPSLLDDDGSRQRRSRWRRVIGAISVVALIAIIVGVAVTRSGAKDGGYRTATASAHSVNQILNGVATVQPVRQASVAFPVSGTVASVAVSVGDSVTTGQPLAALDTTALQATVTQQQAAF